MSNRYGELRALSGLNYFDTELNRHLTKCEIMGVADELLEMLRKVDEQILSDRWNIKKEHTVGQIIHDLLDNYEDILR